MSEKYDLSLTCNSCGWVHNRYTIFRPDAEGRERMLGESRSPSVDSQREGKEETENQSWRPTHLKGLINACASLELGSRVLTTRNSTSLSRPLTSPFLAVHFDADS